MPDVYLLVGLTGAGKTTYSKRILEPAGVVRLSADELIYQQHGRYSIDYPASAYREFYIPALETVRELLGNELDMGHDVALDLGIWSRADRDDWKSQIEVAGARWRLLYFPVSHAELRQRLDERNRLDGPEALRVGESDLDDFYARFSEPTDEGEEVIQPGSF